LTAQFGEQFFDCRFGSECGLSAKLYCCADQISIVRSLNTIWKVNCVLKANPGRKIEAPGFANAAPNAAGFSMQQDRQSAVRSIQRVGWVEPFAKPINFANCGGARNLTLTPIHRMLIARFAPQLNVFDLSMAVRNLFFFIVMPFHGTFLIEYFADEIGGLRHVLEDMRRFLQ
jgi:hypothetical protein